MKLYQQHESLPTEPSLVANHGTVSLESVLITEELDRRPARPPDYVAENGALISLAQELANSPRSVLQKLVELAMQLCKAQSAGVSLLDTENNAEVFRWDAITGRLAVNVGGSIARDLSPCGVVLDRNTVLLFGRPERHYSYPVLIDPPMEEALLAPFHLGDKPIGTIWVIAHDKDRKFDREDARVLQDLGRFASSAFQTLRALDALQTEVEERKKTAEALEESESRFRLFMDNSPAIAWIKDEQGKYVYISRTYEKSLKLRLQDWIGKTDFEIWPEQMARQFRENDLQVFRSNRAIEVLEEGTRSDGVTVTWLNSKFPLSNARGQRFVAGIGLDITERRKAEQALIRNEKLASVGRMAATISHEINNPLAAAVNAVFLSASDPGLPASTRTNLQLADQALRQIAHITKQALGFYRESGPPVSVQVPEILDATVDLFSTKLRAKSIRVQRRYRGECRVRGIEGELRQIVSNLVGNSIDALAESGTLYLRANACAGQSQRVRLTLADNGSGIRPEILKQIFEPFFTTKESVGTGLGLWVTRELVRKHAGHIRVKSRPAKGTVFSIWLPAKSS